jgi:phosphoglycerate dehydrogenase-like enzyme
VVPRRAAGDVTIASVPKPSSAAVALPDAELIRRLEPSYPTVRFVEWDLVAPAPERRFDLVMIPYMTSYSVLAALEGLDVPVVQSPAIGFEGAEQWLPEGVTLCNAATVHELPTAELCLALLLADLRGVADSVRAQQHAEWNHHETPGLIGRRVLLIGYGGVGKAIRRVIEPFGVTTTAVATSPRVEEGIEVIAPDGIWTHLGEADVVILALPLTERTRRLADSRFLAAMKPGALLVNVGRGPTVDTNALVNAVAGGHVRAALDVTDPEPLPAHHPLWRADGVIITPHIGGHTATMRHRIEALLRRQLDALLASRPLVNVVIDRRAQSMGRDLK